MKNETLLVVDDQIENIDLLVDILAQDFNLKVAKSGPEALEIMNSDSIDLVLLDILMEEMDGFEVLRQIKENPETNPIPVIFLTALSEFKDETKGLKMGAVDFISKPINPLVVLARVDAQLTVLRQKKELERTNAILSRENERNERELELARNIQRSFIPTEAPECGFCSWDIHYSPLRAIGGDFFDFVKFGPNKMGFFLGDVSGHGIPAALVTSMIKVALPFAHQHPDNPSFFLRQLNHMLMGKISNNFVGAFYGIFDWEHRTLTYALAGKTKPVVYYPDGRIKVLESTGTALGLVKNGQEVKDNSLLLSKGLRFLFHTDGIQEALEELNPRSHWDEFIYNLKSQDGEFNQQVLEKALSEYKAAQNDDITLITMSLK